MKVKAMKYLLTVNMESKDDNDFDPNLFIQTLVNLLTLAKVTGEINMRNELSLKTAEQPEQAEQASMPALAEPATDTPSVDISAKQGSPVVRHPLIDPEIRKRMEQVAVFQRDTKLHAVQSAWFEFENQVSNFYGVEYEQWQSMPGFQRQLMLQQVLSIGQGSPDVPVMM